MQGFRDQIARQYDTLVTQTQIESTTSSENFVTPSSTDLTHGDNWLELGEFNDEPIVPTNNESGQSVASGMVTSEFRYAIEIDSFVVESVCAATEENNKKNATSEVSEQRILIENDMNSSVPNISSLNILTVAQSSNLTTPTTINLANIPIIDDETNVSEQQQSQKQVDDGTTSEDDDDEQMQLKRLKPNNEQIEAPVEEDEDEDEEQQEEVRRF
jgi:hypothetical protein